MSLPRRVMDDAAAAMKQMELYCIAHPGSPLSSTIYSWQALGRVARTECGRRNSRYRSHCCGGASRIRRAIFGWPAAAERGDQASSVISSASTPGWLIASLHNRLNNRDAKNPRLRRISGLDCRNSRRWSATTAIFQKPEPSVDAASI